MNAVRSPVMTNGGGKPGHDQKETKRQPAPKKPKKKPAQPKTK